MATRFYINPAKVVIFPPDIDDNIVNGIQFGVEMKPNPIGNTLVISPGQVRINSRFMDLPGYETNLAGINTLALTKWRNDTSGLCLMVIDDNKNIGYVNDNVPSDKLVVAIVERRQVGPDMIYTITPIDYSGMTNSGGDVPTTDTLVSTSIQTQLQMIFQEMAINKSKDAYLKYEEMLESLPAFNNAFVETFANTSLFLSNELAYNAYTKTVGLGIVAPYPTNVTKKLVEKITLLNPVTEIFITVDALANGQVMTTRVSFDNGTTWQTHTEDKIYTLATPSASLRMEFGMSTDNSATSPMLRSWAAMYLKTA